jgi:hypothetical protein
MVLHLSNSQVPNGSLSQPQTSNPLLLNQHVSQQQASSNSQKLYSQGPNVTQPPMPFVEDTNFFDTYRLDFLDTDAF